MGAAAADLAEPILAEAGKTARAPRAEGRQRAPADLTFLMEKMAEAQTSLRNPAEVRAEIGAWALAADTPDEAAFIASFGRSFAGLPADYWPQRGYACTAVDAETGAFQLWTGDSGVGVTKAVASSCSVPGVYPPVTIGGRRYIDGGMRSGTNADVAAGHDLVLIVVVRAGEAAGPAGARIAARLTEEEQILRDGGAEVVVVGPDEPSRQAFGANLMDFRRRGDAARAGLAQGAAEAERLRALWA
jgi:NTE family protein